MALFRSDKVEHDYRNKIQEGLLLGECRLCLAESIVEFDHWRIIENAYPYDRVAKVHNMLIPKEHITGDNLPPELWKELRVIKRGYVDQQQYDFLLESTSVSQSIPDHFHLHLLQLKDF